MRHSFSGFYGVSEDAIGTVFTSAKTIFIFDANIFLTLYRCEEETRNRFFEIWENIKGQCWFPHQVCLEYQRNRLKVVKDSRDALSKIPKKISGSIAELKTQIFDGEYNQTISRYSNLKGELTALFEQIESAANNFNENHIDLRKKNIDFLTVHDVIRDRIDELTDGRIGPAPENQDVINKLNTSGKTRYKYKTGPGYDDSPDKNKSFYSFDGINYDAEYGDYYVWSQILEYVEGKPECNVVYVTNDAKSDFYYKIEGKVRGPNESLRTEIKKHGVAEFILQNIDTFLHHANNYLNAEISESVITELKNSSISPLLLTPSAFSGTGRVLQGVNAFYQGLTGFVNYNSRKQLYRKFEELQNVIKNHNIEINELGSVSLEELDSLAGPQVLARQKLLIKEVKELNDVLLKIGHRLAELEEEQSIQQLLENE